MTSDAQSDQTSESHAHPSAWDRLRLKADLLEQAMAAHLDEPSVQKLASAVGPVIAGIRSGEITEPIGRDAYPSMVILENETNLQDFVPVINAHGEFREEVTVGGRLTPTQQQIIAKMQARRDSRAEG